MTPTEEVAEGVSRIADRVIELSSGRIVRDGPPRDGKAAIADLQW